ncbi:MAG: hypothetical protein MJE77_36475 [Proteobacteria bacterium]|nr:hypothetical protein [Pseudomonadota bacterium]
MSLRRKSREGDEELVIDEAADPVERGSALGRLLADGRREYRPLTRQWLAHSEPVLREAATSKLLIYFRGEPDIDEDIARVIALSRGDAEPGVRGAAISALSGYLELTGLHRERILQLFVNRLEYDDDYIVQMACYEELLSHIAPERVTEMPPHTTPFDRDQHVDWSLLSAWRTPPNSTK